MSSCLTGEAVRYDGRDKLSEDLMRRVAPFAELVAVCPESEAGLGVPRETMDLQRVDSQIVLIGNETGADYTGRLRRAAKSWLESNPVQDLDGFVFKSGSPSCGIETVPVREGDDEVGRHPGLFAAMAIEQGIFLPTCTEIQLADPPQRRHFLQRAFARARWRQFAQGLESEKSDKNEAVAAHFANYDLNLIARGVAPLRWAGDASDDAGLRAAATLLFAGLDSEPQVDGQVNALAKILEHIDVLDAERDALAILIKEVELGRVDVEVARQLARGLCARGGDDWLRGQHFLDPFPTTWQTPVVSARPSAHA